MQTTSIDTNQGVAELVDDENGKYEIKLCDVLLIRGEYSGGGPYTAEIGSIRLYRIAALLTALFELIEEGGLAEQKNW